MFGFKKTVDDILGLINKLSDDKKQELLSRLSGHEPDTTDEKEIAEAETDAEEKGETGEAAEDESVAAQEADKGEEDSQTAEDRMHESEGTELADEERAAEEGAEQGAEEVPAEAAEPPAATEATPAATETADDGKDLDDAQTARITALESEIASLKELIARYMGEDENRDFGLAARAPEGGDRREERTSAIMRAYAGDRAGDYM